LTQATERESELDSGELGSTRSTLSRWSMFQEDSRGHRWT
jgi:hypothetical protein